MKSSLSEVLSNTAAYLMELSRDRTQPEEAQARLGSLRNRHPDMELDLLWEEEAFDSTHHYDVLLHIASEGTVSLSFCPDRALPWPLRGVQRWNEANVVRVNNTFMKIDQAIACLDFVWDEAPLINRLINVCLIQDALAADPITLSDHDLQWAMNGFRRAHKLYTVSDTKQWMDQHGMTHDQLERYVSDEAIMVQLRERVANGRVDPYFDQHRVDFDRACFARLCVATEAEALSALRCIRDGHAGFYEVAEQHLRPNGDGGVAEADTVLSVIERRNARSEFERAIFAANAGDLIGPFPATGGHAIARVVSSSAAELDQRTRNTIKGVLFEEWLAERRQEAKIEWYWGNASRIARTLSSAVSAA